MHVCACLSVFVHICVCVFACVCVSKSQPVRIVQGCPQNLQIQLQ